jgi:hypothetical protein
MSDMALEDVLARMSPDEKAEVFAILEEIERRNHAQECRDDFLKFVCHMNPNYIVGAHHKRLAGLLEDMAYERLDRIAVSIPPRHGKSELISVFFPAWFLGKFPDKSIIMTSHTADLSVDFGRKVRNIVDSEEYRVVFPEVTLAADSKSAGRWNTNSGGSYYSCGVGAALAGRGCDIALCLPGYRKVYTKRGLVTIDNVKKGDFVLGQTGWGEVSSCQASLVYKTTCIDGARYSSDHPVYVVGKGFIPAHEVKPNDQLLTLRFYIKIVLSTTLFMRKLWVKAKELLGRPTMSGR